MMGRFDSLARDVTASPAEVLPSGSANRLLAYAVSLTAAVGLLAGVATALSHAGLFEPPLRHLRADQSGAAALATARLVGALSWVALGLLVVGPVVVAVALLRRGDNRWLGTVTWTVVALVAVLVVAPLLLLAVSTPSPYPDAVALVVSPLVVYFGYRAAVAGGGDVGERPGWAPSPALTVALALVGTVVVTWVVGTGVVADPAGNLLVSERRGGPPAVAWDFEYTAVGDGRGVVTITHDGGARVPASRVSVRSTGFADVNGVHQTARGPWQGETSNGSAGDPDGSDGDVTGPVVARGDAVTVGVTTGCTVRVVYETAFYTATMGKYHCPASSESVVAGRSGTDGGTRRSGGGR